MLGISLALAGGVLLSLADAGKKFLTKSLVPEQIILLMFSFGLGINILFFSLQGFPHVEWSSVWMPALVCGVVAAVGELLFLYGLRGSDLSIAMPLFAFLPIFSSIFGFVLFREVPSALGGMGAFFVVIGAYLLVIERPLGRNVFLPFSRLLSYRASGCVLLSAFTGAMVFVGQRFGVKYSSPLAFYTLILAVDWFIFLILVVVRGIYRLPEAAVPASRAIIIGTGIAWAVGLGLLYASYNYTLAVYTGAAAQLQMLISISLGALIFKESGYLQRIVAGCVMLCGVLIISWANR
jgi:drug/metabolite transporter (DMT)-like permease